MSKGDNTLKTDRDGRNERFVARTLGYRLGLRVELADDAEFWSPYDLRLYDDDALIGIVEIKSRRIPHDRYPDAPVSHFKLAQIINRAAALGVPPIFMVKYKDRIRWVDARDVRDQATPGLIQRLKPHANGAVGANDSERGYFLPITFFRDLDDLGAYLRRLRHARTCMAA